jgi:hypothetical protein
MKELTHTRPAFYDDNALLAKTWQQGLRAEQLIEDEVEEIFPGMVHHLGTDDYDNSIELYFMPDAPADFAPEPEQCARLCQLGFSHGWCNFTDKTEVYFGPKGIDPAGRKFKEWSTWTEESHAEWEKGNFPSLN